MSQLKHVVSAILLLCIIIALYKTIVFVQQVKVTQDKPTIIDDYPDTNKNQFEQYAAGKQLFQTNCATCHAVYKVLTGPALYGLEERGPWKKKENIVKFINNPVSFSRKNKYAASLIKEYGQLMPAFPNLNQDDVQAILNYIKESSRPRY